MSKEREVVRKQGVLRTMKANLILAVALAVVAGCMYNRGGESVARSFDKWTALTRLPCVAEPDSAKLLDESGALALISGETAEDSAFNNDPNSDYRRNSLFLRRRTANGTYQWRLILTTGSNWRIPDGIDQWCASQTHWIKDCFCVLKARFAADGRHLWLVCVTDSCTFTVVCSYDVQDRIFRALIDGADVEDARDGTILVKEKKFYPNDDHGAAWHDVWITPDGTIVRKGVITLRGCDI